MATLLSIRGTLAPEDAKTVRSFSFEVPEGVEAMALVVEWTPHFSDDRERNRAAMEAALAAWGAEETLASGPGGVWAHPDVKRCVQRLPNLLNTVLVEPSGRWRGRSDRGKATREQPLVIDPLDPGPGFMPGPLPRGTWSLDLEVHSVVTASCEFFLEITTRAAGRQAARPAPRPRASARPADASSPRAWFRGELHTHTRHSDGSHHVDELLRRARDLGLHFVALTDHNTTSGGDELRAASFPGILGAELTTFRGHHVCLGIEEMVPWHKGGRVLDVNEVASAVRAQGGLFTLTHPFNLGDPICTGCRWMTPELDRAHVDLVEIWHRRWTGDVADNQAAYRLWNELWRQGHRPTAIGVRDWHNKAHEGSLPGPLPTTVVKARSTSQEDLLDALRRGAAYITRGPHVEPRLHVDGPTEPQVVELGRPGLATSGPVRVAVDVEDLASVRRARLDLLRCGERVASVDVERAGVYELVDAQGGPGWWRVELHGLDDGDAGPLAITNHLELR